MEYLRKVDPEQFNPEKFSTQHLASRATGVNSCRLYVGCVPTGKAGPGLHIHPFDQFYYVLRGKLNVQVGKEYFVAEPNTLVVLPEGVPHRQWNEGPEDEYHIAILIPEPEEGVRFDIPVDPGSI